MNALDKAVQTQLNDIQTKTRKSLGELGGIIRNSGLTKHGEIRDLLKRDLGLATAMPTHQFTLCLRVMARAWPRRDSACSLHLTIA